MSYMMSHTNLLCVCIVLCWCMPVLLWCTILFMVVMTPWYWPFEGRNTLQICCYIRVSLDAASSSV
jgi:hypothetical protein